MIVELELDLMVETRFFFSKLPAELLESLGQHKQTLYDAIGSAPRYGAEGTCEIEAAGKRFVVFLRLGSPFVGEGGQEVHTVRVLHIIENTSSRG